MRLLVLVLLAIPTFASEDPPPTAEQQNAILGNIGSFVENYLNTVPNLICLRTTEQYQGNKKGEHWRQLETLTSRLTLVNGEEKATLERVNGKPLSQVRKPWRRALSTEGEFGAMLGVVLSKAADATITWKDWETLNGHHVAVFNYAIDKRHSTMKFWRDDLASSLLPYSGSLFADPESGTVWRVMQRATDFPPEFQTVEMETILDYGEISISGKPHILPIHATAVTRNMNDTNRNEITFSDYRKFEAESTITFGDSSTPKQ